jgi:hypothetical protein
MIGFSFGTGMNRVEERRQAGLAEANSIETTGFYARLLPAQHNAEVLNLFATTYRYDPP